MLSARDLRVTYGRGDGAIDALRGVDLEMADGEVVGLLGPNGAGKSTLMSTVAGLITPTTGRVEIHGFVQDGSAAVRQLIGFAPQDEGVYPTLTVRENLAFFATLSNVARSEQRERIDETAGSLLLGPLLDRQVRTLSGGQRRRVHTAIALLHRPPLLLLDEPTAGVDVETRAALLDLVRRSARQGQSTLYSTHNLGELEQLGCRVVVIDDGSIVADGSVGSLVAAHGDSSVEVDFAGPPVAFDYPAATSVRIVESRLVLSVDDPVAHLEAIASAATRSAVTVLGVRVVEASLESAYRRLVGAGRVDPEARVER